MIRPQLDYQNFEKQCFLINKTLMQEMPFFRIYKLRKKFGYIIYSNSHKNKITKDLLSGITEKFNGIHIVRMEAENDYIRLLT